MAGPSPQPAIGAPMIILYIGLQKYYVQGLLAGWVK